MSQKIYFGHPINTYNTELEKFLLEKIAMALPGWEIENPNQPHHDAAYKLWAQTHGNGMNYFFNEVLPKCGGGIFLPFRDGAWGKGVFGEALALANRGCGIYAIMPKGIILELSADDLPNLKVLTVEETRARIRTTDGKSLLPY